MRKIFKNRKVEITGLLAWSLLTFAVINISIQLFQNVVLSLVVSTFFCGLLNSFFLMAFYEFKLSSGRLWSFSLIYVGQVVAFQFVFDWFVKLNGAIGSWQGYILIATLLVFWNMIIGVVIKILGRVKK